MQSIRHSVGPWNALGKKTGVGSHSLLQGIFPTQGSNADIPHCGQIAYIWAQKMQKQSPNTHLKQWRADSSPQKMELTLQHGSLPPKTYTIAQEEMLWWVRDTRRHSSRSRKNLLLCFCSSELELKLEPGGTSLVVQWLRLQASNAGSANSIPGQGTKIPHAVHPGQKKLFLNLGPRISCSDGSTTFPILKLPAESGWNTGKRKWEDFSD